ncbi:MAG TPA: hypothetical protein VGB85_24185 [Nannocystis sp.]|jgi:hypothetical protein
MTTTRIADEVHELERAAARFGLLDLLVRGPAYARVTRTYAAFNAAPKA